MNQRIICAAIAAFVLAISCLSTTVLAQGNGMQTSKVDFENPSYYNPCCDEWISLAGTVHVNTRTTVNADGSVKFTYSYNLSNTKGTGQTSGIEYHFNEKFGQSQTYMLEAPHYPATGTMSFTTHVVGKGKGGRECSATVKFSNTFAFDANGNLTIDETTVEFICANGNAIN
jgi:hypothetical protein